MIDVAIWLVLFALRAISRALSFVVAWYVFCLVVPHDAKALARAASRVAERAIADRERRRERS